MHNADSRPADRMTARSIGYDLHQVLPRLTADALEESLWWLADNGHLVGRQRFIDLANELRGVVSALRAQKAAA
ncbi:hypothetical protein [Pseudonocardia alni]|uniref:hypothetical protein n=1 Tax=Pseudonocardia alni TaxID=33907 RepID=UPI0033C9655D